MEQAGDELTSIVDAGGAVLNVIVNHRVYGKITADLDIRNRRDVERYLHDIESGKSFPLLTVTSGYHFHRIAAEDEQTSTRSDHAQGEGLPCRFNALRIICPSRYRLYKLR
ncbi:MAG: 3H domain-containing protein [Collinsella sp.]